MMTKDVVLGDCKEYYEDLFSEWFHTDGFITYYEDEKKMYVVGYVRTNATKRREFKDMKKLPIVFGKVSDTFDIDYINLETLEGCPYEIGGNFHCTDASLLSLKGCPETIEGDMYLNCPYVESLEGISKTVKGKVTLGSIPNVKKLIIPKECEDFKFVGSSENIENIEEYKHFKIKQELKR
jgi:hypothetical protein